MSTAKPGSERRRGLRGRPRGQRVDVRKLSKSGIAIPVTAQFTPDQIRALRARYGISQAVLARLIGTSTGAVTQWEQGLRRPTRIASKMLDLVYRKGPDVLL